MTIQDPRSVVARVLINKKARARVAAETAAIVFVILVAAVLTSAWWIYFAVGVGCGLIAFGFELRLAWSEMRRGD